MVSSLSPQQFRQGEQVDLVGSYLGGQRAAQGNKLQQQAIQQNEQELSAADYEMATQRLSVINRLAKKVKDLDPSDRYAFVQSINPEMLQSVGIDPKQVSSVQLDDTSLDALIAQTGAAMPEDYRQTRVQSTQRYKNGTVQQILSNGAVRVIDPSGREVTGLEAQQVIDEANQYETKGAIDKAGGAENAKNESKLNYEPIITRENEKAKADVELSTKPAITTAVNTAANEADATAKNKAVAQKNALALELYRKGRDGVSQALAKTTTGPIAGRLPAVTANQQTAEGALSAMAPVLKEIFRQAGEGTFTKDDQATLMAMLPTRDDLPEARDAKLKNVDELVEIKLSGGSMGGSGKGSSTPGINSNTGSKKLTYDPVTRTFK